MLIVASDPNSAYAFAYNGDGFVTSADNADTPKVPHVVLAQGYDLGGDMTSQSATINGTADFANSYAFDADQRLTTVQQQGANGGVNQTVAANGGLYGVANFSANIGVTALYAVTPCGAVKAFGSGVSAANAVTNVYQGWVQQNPGMMAQGAGSLAMGLMNPSCFVAGTSVLVPFDQGAAVALVRDAERPPSDDGEEGLAFWPLLAAAVGVGGYAAAAAKASDDEQKRREAARRSLFGGHHANLDDEDTAGAAMDLETDADDYERRVDALCQALFHGDDLSQAAATRGEPIGSCGVITRAGRAVKRPRGRESSMRANAARKTTTGRRRIVWPSPPKQRNARSRFGALCLERKMGQICFP